MPIFEKNELLIEERIEDVELSVNIDIDQFMRVLDNLLSNALKYAHKNSTALVEACRLGNKIRITVKNKGDYIPENEIDKIFDRLYKIDKSRQDSLKGSGIGLSIAKKIIELHGGRIWATCENDDIWINILI
jgi:signal transduction histidine kinase